MRRVGCAASIDVERRRGFEDLAAFLRTEISDPTIKDARPGTVYGHGLVAYGVGQLSSRRRLFLSVNGPKDRREA